MSTPGVVNADHLGVELDVDAHALKLFASGIGKLVAKRAQHGGRSIEENYFCLSGVNPAKLPR
jgi:hypothetical protein